MRFLLVIITFLLISLPSLGQSEKPQTIIVPTGSLGDISETRIKILEKTLESKLGEYFSVIPKQLFEEAQEKAFEELDYEECTEDQCILLIQEMLQGENAFQLLLIHEEGDTQISITWTDLDQKRVKEEYCEGCKTKELRKNIADLVEKLVGGLTNIDKNDIKKNTKTTLIRRNNEVDSSGFFIAVGGVCEIIKSDNGKDWQVVNTDNCKRLLGVTRGNNQIIAVGISGKIFNSEDGVDWFLNDLDTNNDLHEIYFHKNIFIIVGEDGLILVSQNGDLWEEVDSGVSVDLFDITFFNGEFIIVGEDGTILVSSNGRNWKKIDSNTSDDLSGVTNSNKLIVTGGEDGLILHSKDSRNWSKSKISKEQDIFGVYFENKLFFAVGKGGIEYSKNGKAWKSIKLDNKNPSVYCCFIRGLVYGNNKFISVGDRGTLFISDNGRKWEPVVSNAKWDIHEVNFFSN